MISFIKLLTTYIIRKSEDQEGTSSESEIREEDDPAIIVTLSWSSENV